RSPQLLFCCCTSRRRHTRFSRDWSSDVCSSDLDDVVVVGPVLRLAEGLAGHPPAPAGRQGILGVEPAEVVEVDPRQSVVVVAVRSEERRVGEEWKCWEAADDTY